MIQELINELIDDLETVISQIDEVVKWVKLMNETDDLVEDLLELKIEREEEIVKEVLNNKFGLKENYHAMRYLRLLQENSVYGVLYTDTDLYKIKKRRKENERRFVIYPF